MFEYTKELSDKILNNLIEVKVDEDKDWMFDVVATTEDIDRDGEIIKVKWRDIKNWEKNPVILANHQYTIETIIWKGVKFYTSDGVKRMKGYFSKTNPLGVLARNLYNEGMLKTVSVWFMVKERDMNDRLIITKAELLEVSFVAVPCNPNAVSLDGKLYDEAVQKWFITEIKELPEVPEDIKEPTIQEVMDEIQEIKAFIKCLTDDKVSNDELNQEIEEAKSKKKLLQQFNKSVDDALKTVKLF